MPKFKISKTSTFGLIFWNIWNIWTVVSIVLTFIIQSLIRSYVIERFDVAQGTHEAGLFGILIAAVTFLLVVLLLLLTRFLYNKYKV
jgi:heme/copper-type cytochrome/quinol oxidase subunit 2